MRADLAPCAVLWWRLCRTTWSAKLVSPQKDQHEKSFREWRALPRQRVLVLKRAITRYTWILKLKCKGTSSYFTSAGYRSLRHQDLRCRAWESVVADETWGSRWVHNSSALGCGYWGEFQDDSPVEASNLWAYLQWNGLKCVSIHFFYIKLCSKRFQCYNVFLISFKTGIKHVSFFWNTFWRMFQYV